MNKPPPQFDADGLHVLDPKDRLGHKTRYITTLQEHALKRHLPEAKDTAALALDIGCGYGRLTALLERLGWQAMGIDPSPELIEYARSKHPDLDFRVGGLPTLPEDAGNCQLILLHNLLRSLHLLDKLEAVKGIGQYLAPGGWLAVVDNVRDSHPAYVQEARLVEMFREETLLLDKRVALRSGRWWLTYLIRYGLVPSRWLERIADYELALRERARKRPRWTYHNVLFMFRKPQAG